MFKSQNTKRLYTSDSSIKNVRVDGMAQILSNTGWRARYLWLWILLGSTALCLWLTVKTVLAYAQFSVTSTYRVHASTVNSEFPTVSICPINPFNTPFALELLRGVDNFTTYKPLAYHNMLDMERRYKEVNGSYLSSKQKRAMSVDLDAFVVKCTFRGRGCNLTRDFRYRFFPYFMQCFQFTDEHYPTSSDAENNALVMELYVGLPDVLLPLVASRGLRLFITERNEDPFKNTPYFITILSGMDMRIDVTNTIYNQYQAWPFTYSSCNVDANGRLLYPIKDRSLFDWTIKKNYTYAQDSCLVYCFQKYSTKRCNCTAYWIEYRPNKQTEYCIDDKYICSHRFYYDVFNVGDFIERNCLEKCPFECRVSRLNKYESLFAYNTSEATLARLRNDSIFLKNYGNHSDFRDRLSSNIIKFSVNYNGLTRVDVNEVAEMSWDKLLGVIGGHLHLFLGMSLLSFVEIGEMAIKVTFK